MHLKSCCALLLLALVACQAAPSAKITEEKSIETDPKELNIEEAGAEKDRSKKSTTLCVEFGSGKEQPCNQLQQPAVLVQEPPKQLLYLSQPQQPPQTVIVPAPQPMVRPTPEAQQPARPTVQVQTRPPVPMPQQTIQVQPQPAIHMQPQPTIQVQPQQTIQVQPRPTVQVLQPQPAHIIQVQPQPKPQLQQQNAIVLPSAPIRQQPTNYQVISGVSSGLESAQIINIIPTSATAPCEQTKQQPQSIRIIQSQRPSIPIEVVEQQRPVVTIPYKIEAPPAPCASEVLVQPQVELVVPQVVQQQPTVVEIPALYSVSEAQPENDLYECSCHGKQNLKSRYPKLTDILTVFPGNSLVSNSQPASNGQIASSSPLVSSSLSVEPISSSASLGPLSTSTSLGPITSSASLGSIFSGSTSHKNPLVEYNLNAGPVTLGQQLMEARRHKQKVPAQLSVKIPVSTATAPISSANAPVQYYTSYYPLTDTASYKPYYYHENNYAYAYPNSYSYLSETSAPSITVNASGPFYRESQHTDNGQESLTTDKPQKNPSTSSSSEGSSINQKRETDLTQLNDAAQKQREQNSPVMNSI